MPGPRSLIGFGFTIYQFFGRMAESKLLPPQAPRNFGIALVLLVFAFVMLFVINAIQAWSRRFA